MKTVYSKFKVYMMGPVIFDVQPYCEIKIHTSIGKQTSNHPQKMRQKFQLVFSHTFFSVTSFEPNALAGRIIGMRVYTIMRMASNTNVTTFHVSGIKYVSHVGTQNNNPKEK